MKFRFKNNNHLLFWLKDFVIILLTFGLHILKVIEKAYNFDNTIIDIGMFHDPRSMFLNFIYKINRQSSK